MPIYRLYFLNPQGGQIDGYEDVASADDIGAICLVNERPPQGPAELWLGSRKVIAFGTPPAPAPSTPATLEPAHAGHD